MRKSKVNTKNLKIFTFLVCVFGILFLVFGFTMAQKDTLEFALDVTSDTIPLPKIFRPNIDLSGRGFFSRQDSWPKTLAAQEVLDMWQQDIGFGGLYRLQYNLWEINESAKDKDLQEMLLANYENIIKKVSDAGGVVILDIFGTPAGLGKVLDKKSSPYNLKAFKALIKEHIKKLSCDKRYNIWYEVWSAPDLDDFFLGRKQEYLSLYRVVAEGIKELEDETKVHIPLGGPGVSWWFQNLDGNNIITPERSLIYELIRFCAHYDLPLDFITWHAYSTDPEAEYENTTYKKNGVALIRDWFSYFHFDPNPLLIVDEWNYDRGANVLLERKEASFVCASYIPSRIKNMYEAGINYQLFFSLEDFQKNEEGVIRNTGIFWFGPEASEYRGGPKSIYNVFKMLKLFGENLFLSPFKFKDNFVGVIATKGKDYITILIYNYIDPDIAINYLSREIASLNSAERRRLLGVVQSDRLAKILRGQLDIATLRSNKKTKALLNKARELNDKAAKFMSYLRNINLSINNLKGNYAYQRYLIDLSCSSECKFVPVQEKEIAAADLYQETLTLSPYSLNLVILKQKPQEPLSAPSTIAAPQPENENKGNSTNNKSE